MTTGSETKSSDQQETLPEPMPGSGLVQRVKGFFGALGPGLITGASDDDPSGIATYSMVGARAGYGMLWTSLLTLPLMATVDFISAKIAMVSGRGLAGVLRDFYPRPLLIIAVLLLSIANVINAATDIAAIGAAVHLVVPFAPQAMAGIIAAAVLLAVQFLAPYRVIAATFKWLTLSLFCYVATCFLVHVDMHALLLHSFIPHLEWNKEFLTLLVAILGTTISPYCLFWQADEEVEEERSMGRFELRERLGATRTELRTALLDVDVGSFVAVGVMYSIMLATAATLHGRGITSIDSAVQAAEALRPLAGDAACILFALGIVGTGFLAVPILTGSVAYALAEAFGWKASLSEKPTEDKGFYSVLLASTIIAIAINFSGINPMVALFWTAVINGLLAPPLLVLIMMMANNRKVMGDNVNGPLANLIGWATAIIMGGAAMALIALSLSDMVVPGR